MAIQDEPELPTRSASERSMAPVLIQLVAGILAPYGVYLGLVSTLFFPLIWIYWPPVVIQSGLFITYSLMYGLPGYIQFCLFIYTILGRIIYPFQLGRSLRGKSSRGATILVGLVIETPLLTSVFLAFPVVPLPLCTLIAAILLRSDKKQA